MGDLEETSPIVETTINMLKALTPKPKLAAKYVAKPPFKLIYELVMNLSAGKGFPAPDLFTEAERNIEALASDKAGKAEFLRKVMEAVATRLGERVDCEPPKVLAGKNADKTNAFLQQLARAVTAPPPPAGAAPPAAEDAAPKKKKVVKKAAAAAADAPAAEAAPAEGEAAPAKPKKKAAKKEKAEDESPPSADPAAAAPAEAAAAAEEPAAKPKKKVVKKKAPAADSDAGGGTSPAQADALSAPQEPNAAALLDQFQDEQKPPALAPPQGRASAGVARANASKQEQALADPPQRQEQPQAPAPAAAPAPAPKPSQGVTGVQKKKAPAAEEKALVAAKPPPRIQGAMRAVESNKDNAPRVNVVGERDAEDDEEEVIVTEQAVDGGIADDAVSSDLAITGGLVGEIKQSIEDAKAQGGDAGNKKPVTAAAAKKQKMEKDVAKLRESIQSICQSAHPVSKALDYYQEDLDSMDKELEFWRTEAASYRRALEEEENATKASLQPYLAQLQQQDMNIREQEDKIMAMKAAISENARKIEHMLSLVVRG